MPLTRRTICATLNRQTTNRVAKNLQQQLQLLPRLQRMESSSCPSSCNHCSGFVLRRITSGMAVSRPRLSAALLRTNPQCLGGLAGYRLLEPCLLTAQSRAVLRRRGRMFGLRGCVEFGACVEVAGFLLHQKVFFCPCLQMCCTLQICCRSCEGLFGAPVFP